jgi:flagellar motor switch protein FliN/FliY
MADIPGFAASEAWLIEQWVSRLSHAVASMIGDAPQCTIGTALEDSPPGAEILWWEQPFSISSDATFWVGAPSVTWEFIGNEVLKSAGIDDADNANTKSTYLEILSQSLAGLGQTLSARIRSDVACGEGREVSMPPGKSLPVRIDLGGTALIIYACASKALNDLCEKSLATTPAAGTSSPHRADRRNEAGDDSREYPKGLDLLLDVELPVSISFGRAELPIKDVIKLTTGSIIELNRAITEPVEIIVNNVVIARGEVVVVEGNFGVRIKQVISRKERLRTLR